MDILTKLHEARDLPVDGQLRLPFDARQKSRLKTTLVSGEPVSISLPRGAMLRGGDLLRAEDGRVVEVVAEPEHVMQVMCTTPAQLLRAAYHLGNRHVPVQIGEGWLRIAADHVLEGMLRGLGATVVPMHAPFEPEAGAYGGEHTHDALQTPQRPGRIHEYGRAQAAAGEQMLAYRRADRRPEPHGHEH